MSEDERREPAPIGLRKSSPWTQRTRKGSSLLERFICFVDASEGCWLWKGASPLDYGFLNVKGRHVRAHRLAWELAHGPVPGGLFVLHACDNRSCVRPSHLFLGTPKANTADMMAKDRQTSKLAASDVKQIRRLARRGMVYRAIATRFGVCPRTVGEVVRRETWRHL